MEYSTTNQAFSLSSCRFFKSEISSTSDSSSPTENEHPLTRLAKDCITERFPTDQSAIDEHFEKHRQDLVRHRSHHQFFRFADVPPSVASKLSSSPTSKFVHSYYNTVTRELITKIMPLGAHEAAIQNFYNMVYRELILMQLDEAVEYLGSKIITSGTWVKEADSSWRPLLGSNLTMVLEVGNSESTNHLKTVMHAWLESADAKIGFILLIDRHVPKIHIERWELVPHQPSLTTKTTPFSIAAATSAVTIAKIGNATTVIPKIGEAPYFVIPFKKLLDRPPHNTLERDLVLSERGLKHLAEMVWIQQSEE